MGLFQNMTTDGLEEATDFIPSGFAAIPSGVYNCEVKLVYAGKSPVSNAQNITVVATSGNNEIKETIYISNKAGENFYPDKKDGSKRPLPGFTTIDDLCLLITGQPLADMETETKTVKLYDFDAKAEVPTEVECITALHGKNVKLAVLREIVDKQKKDGNGAYQNTGETRTQNTIDKVLHAETGRTVNEYRHEVETPEFMTTWIERNKDKDRNKAKGASEGSSGPGLVGSGKPGGSSSPAKSLFG